MSDSARKILYRLEAQRRLMAGVDILTNAVKVTMGPGGENVIIEQENGPPILTKDGVTVAKAVNLRSQFENMGVQIVKEAAAKTAETAGDGTTTATVLTQAIVHGGQKLIAAGHNPVKLRKGIRAASDEALVLLDQLGIEVSDDEDIVNVGTVSANGDSQVGEFLAEAMRRVGRNGVITVDEARGFATSLDIVDGFELDRGYISPYFVTNQARGIVKFDKPKILLANRRITAMQDILPLLESTRRSSDSLLIIADDVEGEALKMCVLNSLKGIVKICILRPPEFGETRVEAMQDLCVLFGTRLYSAGEELPTDISELGTCEKFEASRNSSVFVGTVSQSEEDVTDRLNAVKSALDHPGANADIKDYLNRRLARLSGGIAVIRVGGSTELELRERKDRIDDAVHATRAAVQGGIVPGGGTAFLHIIRLLEKSSLVPVDSDELAGWNLLKTTLEAPLRQIVINAGLVPDVVLAKIASKPTHGFDARTGQYCDLLKNGIIDPLPVVMSALEHATSAALNLLSVGCAMAIEKSDIFNE
jgi:chaperonin GroEL